MARQNEQNQTSKKNNKEKIYEKDKKSKRVRQQKSTVGVEATKPERYNNGKIMFFFLANFSLS